jgi:ribosomal protein S18 acetylase RimI-like enzyme
VYHDRNQGHGNELLKAAEDIARENYFDELQLKVYRYDWKEAWYKRNGFEFLENGFEDNDEYAWLRKTLNN